MTTLPPALTRAERRALAAGLLEPYLARVLEKGDDSARLQPLHGLPQKLRPRNLPARTRPPVERSFELPRRPVQGAEGFVDSSGVGRKGRRATSQ